MCARACVCVSIWGPLLLLLSWSGGAQVWAWSQRLFWGLRRLERLKHPERSSLRQQQYTVSQGENSPAGVALNSCCSLTWILMLIVSGDNMERLIIWRWIFLWGTVEWLEKDLTFFFCIPWFHSGTYWLHKQSSWSCWDLLVRCYLVWNLSDQMM